MPGGGPDKAVMSTTRSSYLSSNTSKGALASSWRKIAPEIAEQSKGQVKPRIVEQCGVPTRAIICQKSPSETDECGKTDCPVCINEKSKMKNCLKVTPGCTTCKEQQINAVYHGETGRTL